jgi:mannose-6-phosphate isomerase-like protein (cupin superfamily)
VPAATSWSVEAVAAQRATDGRPYHEFVRAESMSLGVYALAAGAPDHQTPHAEDEVYLVVRGRGRFRQGEDDHEVGPGTVLFVPAHQPHRFHDIAEELVLFVAFAPPESGSERPAAPSPGLP